MNKYVVILSDLDSGLELLENEIEDVLQRAEKGIKISQDALIKLRMKYIISNK